MEYAIYVSVGTKNASSSDTLTELSSDIFQCIEIVYVLVLQKSLIMCIVSWLNKNKIWHIAKKEQLKQLGQ